MHFRMPCGGALERLSGKLYSSYLGSLTYIRWESRRGTLTAEHASCPGCVCEDSPKCRRDHRVKQHPKWTVEQLPDATFRWTTPSGRRYTKEPTRYPT